ncbi:MAG: methionine--tRNA ligase subunit beta [Candidatus Diapherotrites archaeon]
MSEKITFNEFKKLDLRTAKILGVEDIPRKDRQFKLTVDVGGTQKTLVAGIKGIYQKEELIGKNIVVVNNLEPRKFDGITSEGMLLAAVDGNNISIVTVDGKVKAGTKVE